MLLKRTCFLIFIALAATGAFAQHKLQADMIHINNAFQRVVGTKFNNAVITVFQIGISKKDGNYILQKWKPQFEFLKDTCYSKIDHIKWDQLKDVVYVEDPNDSMTDLKLVFSYKVTMNNYYGGTDSGTITTAEVPFSVRKEDKDSVIHCFRRLKKF